MISTSIINLLLGTTAAPAGGNPDRSVAQAAIVTAVGNKVYPKKAPEHQKVTPPYITVRQTSGGHVMALSGPEGTAYPTVLVICHALDTPAADSLADNVRKLLNGYTTPSWQLPTTNPVIRGIFLEDDSEDWDPDIYGGELGRHTVPLHFKVWHTE